MNSDFSNIKVDTLVDENDGDYSAGDVSLREAIALVEAGGTITFADSLLAGDGGVIDLSLGALQIDKGVSIRGQNALKLTVKGDGQSNIFAVKAQGSDVLLEGLTIANGANGVAVDSGSVTIVDSVITGNRSNGVTSLGAISLATTNVTDNGRNGVEADGDITIRGGDFSRNEADGIVGGDIDVSDASAKDNGDDGIEGSGNVTVVSTLVSGNVDIGVESTRGYDRPYVVYYDGEDAAISATDVLIEGNTKGLVATANYGNEIAVEDSVIVSNKDVGVEAARVLIDRTTVADNGGIGVASNTLSRIRNSTISTNKGGGIVGSGKLIGAETEPYAVSIELSQSTVSGNGSATAQVGGISADADEAGNAVLVALSQSTIVDNIGSDVGGVYLSPLQTGPEQTRLVDIVDTIVARNVGAIADFSTDGNIFAFGSNLIGDASGVSDFTGNDNITSGTKENPLDPLLGELADNGGPTETRLPLPGSPVIDKVIFTDSPEVSDQRGSEFPRRVDGDGDGKAFADIGAVEAPGDPVPEGGIDDTRRIKVDTLVDENDGDYSAGDVSLREAIALVESGGTIVFADSLLSGNGGVIDLSLGSLKIDKSVSILGQNALKLTVKGDGQSNVFDIDAANDNVLLRGLTISGGVTGVDIADANVTISDSIIIRNSGNGVTSGESVVLTTTNVTDNGGSGVVAGFDVIIRGGDFSRNKADGIFGGNNVDVFGASVRNNGDKGVEGDSDITVVSTVVSGNVGTGIESNSKVIESDSVFPRIDVTDVLVEGNSRGIVFTNDYSGKIFANDSVITGNKDVGIEAKSVDIKRTTISDNGGIGVALSLQGSIEDSTISTNTGGGIASLVQSRVDISSKASLAISQSTISGNGSAATTVGGISIDANGGANNYVSISQSTIVDNIGSDVGGIYVASIADSSFDYTQEITLSNSIVARNVGAIADVSTADGINSSGSNLIGDASGTEFASSDLTGTKDNPLDSLLGELADNGGLTKTHLPLLGSPAIDQISPAASLEAFDQRGSGFFRQIDGDNNGEALADIGAIEASGLGATVIGQSQQLGMFNADSPESASRNMFGQATPTIDGTLNGDSFIL